MSKSFDDIFSTEKRLEGKSVEELLLLVGDEGKGYKPEAMDIILAMGLEANCAAFERGVRDDANADLRNGAMEVLVKFGKEAIPKLLEFLRDKNEEIKNFGAVMLGDIGSREAVVPLIHALRDPDPNVRHAAAEALGKIGDRAALVPLLELLKEDFWQQYPAIFAIGEMRDNRAVPHLQELLSDEMLIEPVMEALGKIGDRRALPSLAAILSDPSGIFAAGAAMAMVAIQKSLDDAHIPESEGEESLFSAIITQEGIANLRKLLQREGAETVSAAVTLLGWLDETSSLPDFFQLLEKDACLEAVEGAILSIGRSAIPTLLTALANPAENVKIVALRSLRWLRGIDDFTLLMPFLEYGSENLQLEALAVLNGTAMDAMLPLLLPLLEKGSAAVKAETMEVLSHYPSATLKKIVADLLVSGDPRKRGFSATLISLADGGVPEAMLSVLFTDMDSEVRKEAVKAAGRLRFAEAVPFLLTALSDSDGAVKEEAVAALAEFTDETLLPHLFQLLGKGGESLDYAIITACGRIGSIEAAFPLVDYLKRGEITRHLEFALIEALAKLKGASDWISQVVSGYLCHPEPDFRRLAVKTMAARGGVEAISMLDAACKDPHWSVRIAALHALADIGGGKALPSLLAAISDPDYLVRKNAVLLLGDIRDIHTVSVLVKQLTDLEMGKYAFESLLKFGRMGLPWLHRMIKWNYPLELRERVIDLIGKIGDRKSLEPLMELFEDPNPSIRLLAIDSLVFCCDSTPLKRLSHIKDFDPDGEVRNKAHLALKCFTMDKFF